MIMHFENLYLEYAVRLSASFLCGLVLGLERKTKHHTVGIRTLVLISMSSTLLSIISYTMAELPGRPQGGDPTRIAAQIVSGIGFLGAGAIMLMQAKKTSSIEEGRKLLRRLSGLRQQLDLPVALDSILFLL